MRVEVAAKDGMGCAGICLVISSSAFLHNASASDVFQCTLRKLQAGPSGWAGSDDMLQWLSAKC
jgi:hypothetical protein